MSLSIARSKPARWQEDRPNYFLSLTHKLSSSSPTPRDIRRDRDGRIIRWSEYGQQTAFGWQIDHAFPTVLGGLDAPSNLRARHWLGNCSAGGLLGALLGSSRNRPMDE